MMTVCFFQKFCRLHQVFQQDRRDFFPPIRRDNRDMNLAEMLIAFKIGGYFRIIGYGGKSKAAFLALWNTIHLFTE